MEDTFIVIMLKNSQSGFLETELGSFRVDKDENLIYNIYAVENGSAKEVHLMLTVDRELLDWEFDAIFDYYDTEVFKGIALAVNEDDEGYDPIWEVVFKFTDNTDDMEQKIERFLQIHKTELYDVYQAIKNLEAEYK